MTPLEHATVAVVGAMLVPILVGASAVTWRDVRNRPLGVACAIAAVVFGAVTVWHVGELAR